MKAQSRREWTNYLFILPIFILFAVFIVYPIVYNILISFKERNRILWMLLRRSRISTTP